MQWLVDSIHVERPAEVLGKGRVACRGDAPTQCLEKLIRLRVDRCYRENGPSRLVRTLAPMAAPSCFPIRVLLTASGNALWVSAVPSNVAYWGQNGKHLLHLRFTAV